MGTSFKGLLFVFLFYQIILPSSFKTFVLESAGGLQHVGEHIHGCIRVEDLDILNTKPDYHDHSP